MLSRAVAELSGAHGRAVVVASAVQRRVQRHGELDRMAPSRQRAELDTGDGDGTGAVHGVEGDVEAPRLRRTPKQTHTFANQNFSD